MTDRVSRVELAYQGRDDLGVMLVVSGSVRPNADAISCNREILPLPEDLQRSAIDIAGKGGTCNRSGARTGDHDIVPRSDEIRRTPAYAPASGALRWSQR